VSEYDLVIIGSGPAGYTAAFEATKCKMKTVIVERDLSRLGGVCLSEGCIPLKGLLHHAKCGGEYASIRDTVLKRVEQIRAGLKSRISSQGIEFIQGEASFVSPREIVVSGEKIAARYFLVAPGSRPRRLFNAPNVFTSEKIFDMDPVPASVLLIGGGVIGCEYASFLASVGVRVEIAEILDSLLYGEDEEAVRTLGREFRKKGIVVHEKTKVTEIGPGNEVVMRQGDREIRGTYDMIFETTGRAPNSAGLGLDLAGVSVSGKGFIAVNGHMQTSAEAIYAAGDCIDSPMLAYTAYKEAETAVAHMCGRPHEPVEYASMPRLVFSSPQVGGVGMAEAALKKQNRSYRAYKYFFRALGKAVMEGHDAGFVKLLEDADSGVILGGSAVGDEIADITNQLAMIVGSGMKAADIRKLMFVHPSYSEIILDALHYGKQ
jgi:dihydrolipoamide dehydrogenase